MTTIAHKDTDDRPAGAQRVPGRIVAETPERIDALLGMAMATAARPPDAEGRLRRMFAPDPVHATALATLAEPLRATGRGCEVTPA